MKKLNIPACEEEQKKLNVINLDVTENSDEKECLLCGEKEYEWGHTEGLMLEHYKPGSPKGILAGVDYIRVRRCIKCNNLQLFHVSSHT